MARTTHSLLGPIVAGALTTLRDRSLDEAARMSAILAQLKTLLSYQRQLTYVVERVYFEAVVAAQDMFSEERHRRRDSLLHEANCQFVSGCFEKLFMQSLRENCLECFRALLGFLTEIEVLGARRFQQKPQCFYASNPLGYLWAIYYAAATSQQSVATLLGYTEIVGQPSTNPEHMTRAARFVRVLRESLHTDDPGYQLIRAIRLVDSVPVAPAVSPPGISPEGSRQLVLTFTPEEQMLLDRVVARHRARHGEASAAEIVTSIIVRLGKAIPP